MFETFLTILKLHSHMPQNISTSIHCLHTHKHTHTTCDLLELKAFFFSSAGSLQATRALMIVGIIVSIAGLGVACMGMKCTTCGGSDKLHKSRVAMTGGIILLVGGEDGRALLEISPPSQ